MKDLNLVVALTMIALVAGCGTTNASDAGVSDFSSDTKILAFLESKTMIMQGNDIPNSPNGYNENVFYGSLTQCYNKVTIKTLSGNFGVTSELGTLQRPDGGTVGTCDRTTVSNEATFTSTTLAITNVANNGACFDILANYGSFAQEGRGKISSDGTTVTLELYFQNQSANSNCAAGPVGSAGVTVLTKPFSGNAQQVYRVQ